MTVPIGTEQKRHIWVFGFVLPRHYVCKEGLLWNVLPPRMKSLGRIVAFKVTNNSFTIVVTQKEFINIFTRPSENGKLTSRV